ncbi:MAG: DUF4105 domain-containing protein [Candidatus Rifleibacteriota bacterium]
MMLKRYYALLLVLFSLFFSNCLEAQVNYRVTGIPEVVRHGNNVYAILRSADGRLFNLVDVDIRVVQKFQGKNVAVEGAAKQADQVIDIRVKSIEPVPIEKSSVVLPPFKKHQKPPRLISQSSPIYKVGDVRWGYIPGKPRNNENFSYLKTTFDTSKVDRAYFVLKPFPPEWIAAHSLLFFTFKPGGMVNEAGEEAAGLFLSIEAYQRTNQNYSLSEGLKNTFGVSWILATYEDYTTQSCEVQKEELYFYPLRLTQSQTNALLAETILQATVNRAGEFYHTVTNNCTNNLIVLINRVLPQNQRVSLWWIPSMIYNMKATTPVVVPKMLKKKGLLGEVLPAVKASNFKKAFVRKTGPSKPVPPVRPVFR